MGEAEATRVIGWLPLVSLMIFFVAYSSGYASVPFIIMGELFPARFRNILGSMSSSVNVLTAFACIRGFNTMQNNLGNDGTFWLFMSSTVLSLVFIFFLLPETKGKSLEEIERMFSSTGSSLQDAAEKPKSHPINNSEAGNVDVNGNVNPDGFQQRDSKPAKDEKDFVSIQLPEADDSDQDDLDDGDSVPYIAPM